ncbi:hypothetical protein Tco_0736285 [Tanacetum coccineum]
MQDKRSAFISPDSLEVEPIIITNESEEEEAKRYEDTNTTSHDNIKPKQQKEKAEAKVALLKAQPMYPNVNQLTKLLITELFGEVKELKKHVQEMEIKLPMDLKDIPNKIETFTSTVFSLTTHVAELKTLQWELPREFLGLPRQVSSVQEHLKTLDALPSLLKKGTDTLNRFATIVENASPKRTAQTKGELIKKDKGKEAMSSKDVEEEETKSEYEDDHANPVNSMVETSKQKKLKKFSFITKGGEQIHFYAEKIEEQKSIEEYHKPELAIQEVEKVKNELVDLMGIDVVTQYYNKLMYDKYCDKMLKRKKSSRIINCDVLTKRALSH